MAVDRSEFEQKSAAMLRDAVHAKWEQSGRDFGREEPPPPTLRIDRVGALLHVRLDGHRSEWRFPWDGSEAQLAEWIETVAEQYWGDYCDPSYNDRRTP